MVRTVTGTPPILRGRPDLPPTFFIAAIFLTVSGMTGASGNRGRLGGRGTGRLFVIVHTSTESTCGQSRCTFRRPVGRTCCSSCWTTRQCIACNRPCSTTSGRRRTTRISAEIAACGRLPFHPPVGHSGPLDSRRDLFSFLSHTLALLLCSVTAKEDVTQEDELVLCRSELSAPLTHEFIDPPEAGKQIFFWDAPPLRWTRWGPRPHQREGVRAHQLLRTDLLCGDRVWGGTRRSRTWDHGAVGPAGGRAEVSASHSGSIAQTSG